MIFQSPTVIFIESLTVNEMSMQPLEHSLLCLLIVFFFCLFWLICVDSAKDESDCSDGYVTDGFATMDVFEYEVDDSSDSEDLYSHGSSSGTDV